MSSSEIDHIFSSLRYDPILLTSSENTHLSGDGEPSPFYMLRFHSDRLLTAAAHFNFPPEARQLAELESLRSFLTAEVKKYQNETGKDGPLKIRVQIDPSPPQISIQLAPFPPVPSIETLFPTTMPSPNPSTPFNLSLDTAPTTISDTTRYKTNRRPHYEAARKRVGIENYTEPRDVILWNVDGEVMETSVANVYVQRNGQWWGMREKAGGLGGTVKRWLMERGLVKVEEGEVGKVEKEEVKVGDWVVVSNGARGVWGGWVR